MNVIGIELIQVAQGDEIAATWSLTDGVSTRKPIGVYSKSTKCGVRIAGDGLVLRRYSAMAVKNELLYVTCCTFDGSDDSGGVGDALRGGEVVVLEKGCVTTVEVFVVFIRVFVIWILRFEVRRFINRQAIVVDTLLLILEIGFRTLITVVEPIELVEIALVDVVKVVNVHMVVVHVVRRVVIGVIWVWIIVVGRVVRSMEMVFFDKRYILLALLLPRPRRLEPALSAEEFTICSHVLLVQMGRDVGVPSRSCPTA